MKTRLFRSSFLILALSAGPLHAEEPCKTRTVPEGESANQRINENFDCLDQKLSRILNLLEAKQQAPQAVKPEEAAEDPKSAYQEKYNYTFRDITVYLTGATLTESEKGYDIITEWSIRNLSKDQSKLVQLVSRDTAITVSGYAGSFKTVSDRIAICKERIRYIRKCAAQDETQWTSLPEGRMHGFTIFISPPIKQKLASHNIAVNARIMVRDKDGWESKDISFMDIKL